MYYFARSPFICLLFYVTYFVFLIMMTISAAILFYCAKETYFPKDTETEPPPTVEPVTTVAQNYSVTVATVAPDEANEMSYDEAYNFCLERKKSLPLPLNIDEEDEIIKAIKDSAAGKCAYVFFAWQADASIRYENRGNHEPVKFRFPTLTIDNTTAWYATERYRYHIKIVDGKPVVVPLDSSDLDTRGYAGLYFSTHGLGEECKKQRYKCIWAVKATGLDMIYEYNNALRSDKKLYGIVYLDYNFMPTSFHLLNPVPDYKRYLSLCSRYVFIYMFGNKRQEYNTTRFSVIDPDYNCMAYETGSGKIVTYPCDGPACPFCIGDGAAKDFSWNGQDGK